MVCKHYVRKHMHPGLLALKRRGSWVAGSTVFRHSERPSRTVLRMPDSTCPRLGKLVKHMYPNLCIPRFACLTEAFSFLETHVTGILLHPVEKLSKPKPQHTSLSRQLTAPSRTPSSNNICCPSCTVFTISFMRSECMSTRSAWSWTKRSDNQPVTTRA